MKPWTVSIAALVATIWAASGAQAAAVPGQGTWETTLQARDLDGNGTTDAFYDTVLDITWLGSGSEGTFDWAGAKAWAAQDRFGLSGWRLPTIVDTGSPLCDYSTAGGTDCGFNVQTKSGDPTRYEVGQTVYSEMAHLFYVTLGNKGACTPGDPVCSTEQPGWGLSNTGAFQNLLPFDYYSGTEYSPGVYAWCFSNRGGFQGPAAIDGALYGLAVHDGNVGVPVPEPATWTLLMAGLLMLFARRRLPR